MATATSSARLTAAAALAVAALASVLAGCGGAAGARAGASAAPTAALRAASPAAQVAGPAAATQFGWLLPTAPPRGWHSARTTSGATLAYPPGWRRVHGDPGTVSAALLETDGRYVGYLNVTPRQGAETLAGWAEFRVHHNAEEGDRSVTRLAAATGLRFRGGRGACVRDRYTTSSGARYEEIACLIAGSRRTSVIVAAASLARWRAQRDVLQRAVSAVSA